MAAMKCCGCNVKCEALHKTGNYMYVACNYDKKVWHGTVNDISEEFGDLLIRIMHPTGGMEQIYFP